MMEIFRKYLLLLRKQDNTRPAFAGRLLIGTFAGIVVGIVVDIFLPFNFIINMLRGMIALVTGISTASFAYLMSIKYNDKKLEEDRFYLPVRKRFSYRQRLNISIVLGILIAIFTLLGTREDFAYTLKSSISIMLIFIIIAFARRYRDEFLKDIYGIPDVRDLEFMNKGKNSKKGNKKSNKKSNKKDNN